MVVSDENRWDGVLFLVPLSCGWILGGSSEQEDVGKCMERVFFFFGCCKECTKYGR